MARSRLTILLAVGAALRLAGLAASAVWYDEAWTLAVARLPLFAAVRATVLDFHPPLNVLVEYLPAHLLPGSELAARLPSALAGVLAIWLVWDLARLLGLSPVAQLAGTALMAVLPYQLWQSQDARVYSLLTVLLLGNAWYGLQGRWWGYGATAGLALYAHAVAPAWLAATGLLVVARHFPGNVRPVAAAGAAAAFAYLPWVPALAQQAARHQWSVVFSLYGLLQAMSLTWMAGVFHAWPLIDALAAAGWLMLVGIAGVKAWHWPALAWLALAPLALVALYSALVHNVVLYRTVSPAAPWGYLLVGAAVDHMAFNPLSRPLRGVGWWLGGAVIALAVGGLVAWNPAARGGELRTVAARIREDWQAGDVIVHAAGTSQLPAAYYLTQAPNYVLATDEGVGMLSTEMQRALSTPRADLATLSWRRAWLWWPRDAALSAEASALMSGYLETYPAEHVARIEMWQMAPVDVYLLSK